MKVVLLGSGNVATHLGKALKDGGHELLQVWSRSPANAQVLAGLLGADSASRLDELTQQGDIYIISVSDDAIAGVSSAFPFKDKLLVHTSGTSGLDILKQGSSHTGVFYPLQTFSKQKEISFRNIPVLTEGSSNEINDLLQALGQSISEKVRFMDSESRRALHIAAVFACNFSNHLYSLAQRILSERHIDFDLLRPLIAETAEKIQHFDPASVQTGPAFRNDQNIVNNHLEYLHHHPELQDLYRQLSQNIINFYEKH